ncbi:MAG: hypothetical protein LBL05_07175 [Synergistaceae bacterium]|jgi:hypothetical protein|nr:hypothetical protein [Synergistaceae bacterium]
MSVSGSPIRARRLLIRLLTVACLVGAGFLMYRLGKEFEVIIDNGPVSVGGVRYEAMPYGTVRIDEDTKGFDMWADDRVIRKMVGKNHRLTVIVLNEDDDSVLKTVERDITLDFNPRAEMVSVSAIIAESGGILTPNPLYSGEPVFVPDAAPAPSTEEGAPDDIFSGMEP